MPSALQVHIGIFSAMAYRYEDIGVYAVKCVPLGHSLA